MTAKLPNDVKLIIEGSGENTKYYAQTGADAASKKELGNHDCEITSIFWKLNGGSTYLSFNTSNFNLLTIGSWIVSSSAYTGNVTLEISSNNSVLLTKSLPQFGGTINTISLDISEYSDIKITVSGASSISGYLNNIKLN